MPFIVLAAAAAAVGLSLLIVFGMCWFFFLDNDDTNDLIFQFAVVFLTQKVILAVNYIEHATLASKPQQTLYYHFIPNKFIFFMRETKRNLHRNLNIEFSLPKKCLITKRFFDFLFVQVARQSL